MSRQALPKKLEEDMRNIPRYKPEPFNIDAVLDTGKENAMFEEVFGSVVKRKERKGEDEAKSSDFTTLLASKLADTEKENKNLRHKLATSSMKITRLEETVEELKDVIASNKTSPESIENISRIRQENTRLQRQLMEMEQFLADYGLYWVGNDNSLKEKVQQDDENHPISEMQHFDLFAKKVSELNSLISEEPAKVVTSSNGGGVKARLAHMSEIVESIKIIMYKNGIMVKRGPFRPAGSDSFNSFTRDILDGYFPSEFRESAPDGVILDLTDKRNEYFKHDSSTESSYRGEEMKAAQFLDRLPKTVIKGGDIVSVRSHVGSKLNSGQDIQSNSQNSDNKSELHNNFLSGNDVVHLSTPAKLALQNNLDYGNDVITSIQVRWYDGKCVFILKMFGSDIVAHVKELIANYISQQGDKETVPTFSLRCAYPPRDLPDDITLHEAKLVPSGTLHAKLI